MNKTDQGLLDILQFVDPTISENEYDGLKSLYNSIYDKNISSTNIISYVILLMKIISTFPEIENVNKKKLVIFSLKKFVELNVIDDEEKNMLTSLIDNVLPSIIDTICSIDSKKILINIESKCHSGCSGCCSIQ